MNLEWLKWSSLLELIKSVGPTAAAALTIIWYQARKIDQLLDRNSTIFEAEIARMAELQNRLLSKILGDQPSSLAAPTVQQMKDAAPNNGPQKELPSTSGTNASAAGSS
jgi:hypothetical protein